MSVFSQEDRELLMIGVALVVGLYVGLHVAVHLVRDPRPLLFVERWVDLPPPPDYLVKELLRGHQ